MNNNDNSIVKKYYTITYRLDLNISRSNFESKFT